MNSQLLIDITGWAGSLMVVIAYGLLSMNKFTTSSKIYQALNILGSACLIINTIFYRSFPSTFVNIVWLIIAVIALTSIIKARRHSDG